MSFKYRVLQFVPREGADPLLVGAIPASEIVKWADAPHKKVGIRAGYQRELDSRRTEGIQEFLNLDDHNVMPSAALVALREGTYRLLDDEQGWTLEVTEPNEDATARRSQLIEEFRGRLSDKELASVEESTEDEPADEDPNPEDDPTESNPPDSYLAGVYKELVSYDAATEARKVELDELVDTFSLPGLIIDGQHRIFGAKELPDLNVVVPVVLMPSIALSEQVFHFYVLNNKAKPLDKRQLRSIISTSLTKQEIDDLYHRFRISGLNADEAQWTFRVASDAESPFRGLVSLRLRGDDAPIDDNVMDQVVARFIKMPRQYNGLKKGVDWEIDDPNYDRRLALFYSLWRAVRDAYPKAWSEASAGPGTGQIFQKVALLQTQEYVLQTLKLAVQFTRTSALASPEELYEQASTALSRVPEKFFTTEWKKKQLDTNKGRAYFLEQMEEVAANEGRFLGNFGLFKD